MSVSAVAPANTNTHTHTDILDEQRDLGAPVAPTTILLRNQTVPVKSGTHKHYSALQVVPMPEEVP